MHRESIAAVYATRLYFFCRPYRAKKEVRALLPQKRTFAGEGGRSNLSTG